jgi:hypothetical protein
MNSAYDRQPPLGQGEEESDKDVLRFNPELATTLADTSTGQEYAVVTARIMGDFTHNRDGVQARGARAFYEVFKSLDPSMRVQAEDYSVNTRNTHIGIKVESLPDVMAMIERGELKTRSFGEVYKESFLNFCEALFAVE